MIKKQAPKRHKGGEFDQRSKARRRAVQALYQWHMTGQTPGEIAQQFLEEQDFRRVDTAFFKSLLSGTVEHQPALEIALSEFMERAPDSLDPMERTILRLGAYELQNHLETPVRVAINEAVELAKLFGSEQTPGFVNAVLDKFAAAARATEYNAAK